MQPGFYTFFIFIFPPKRLFCKMNCFLKCHSNSVAKNRFDMNLFLYGDLSDHGVVSNYVVRFSEIQLSAIEA